MYTLGICYWKKIHPAIRCTPSQKVTWNVTPVPFSASSSPPPHHSDVKSPCKCVFPKPFQCLPMFAFSSTPWADQLITLTAFREREKSPFCKETELHTHTHTHTHTHIFTMLIGIFLWGCIQKFPDWPPGARSANGKALCHYVHFYRYSVNQSREFCRHNLLCCFSMNVCFWRLFRYRLSSETFEYTLAWV
jgi:hypothetical protein